MKKVAILSAITLIMLDAVEAQDSTPLKRMSFAEYGIHVEKNRLGQQYVYKVGNEEEIRLPKGDYLMEGSFGIQGTQYNESFKFTIDDSGQLCDSVLWTVKKPLLPSTTKTALP